MKEKNFRNYIEFYKITRNSIEHFDKILGDFRKMIFALNGIVISAGTAYYIKIIEVGKNIDYSILFWANSILALTNILIWQLEKHYHRYLIMSSKIAEKFEKLILDEEEMVLALTCQLKEARNKEFEYKFVPKWLRHKIYKVTRYIRTYDCLYIFPILISIFFSFIITFKSKNIAFFLPLSISFSSIYLIMGIIIICYSYWFTKHYKGTSGIQDGRTIQNL